MNNNILRLITLLLIIHSSSVAFSQINENSTFLVVEDEESLMYFDRPTSFEMIYIYENVENNWAMRLNHFYIEGHKGNLMKYEVPKEMFNELKRRGMVKEINSFFANFDDLNYFEVKDKFRSNNSPYLYKYVEEGQIKHLERWNLFIVLKSDLSKNYIICYEVKPRQMTVKEE